MPPGYCLGALEMLKHKFTILPKRKCRAQSAAIAERSRAERSYLLIAGDFNFHIDDDTDREAMAFLDLVNSFNLKLHINVPPHQHGHTLDIMLTRAAENFVYNVSATHYLSPDHAALTCSL